MRTVALLLALCAAGCAGGAMDIIVPSGAQAGPGWTPILTQAQIDQVRTEFPLFQPELYGPGAVPSDPATLLPSSFVPARWFGEARISMIQRTPLGIHYQSNGFDRSDIRFSLPTGIDYFDINGQSFSVKLGGNDTGRQVRVTPAEVDRIFLAVRDDLARQFADVYEVSPASITVTFQPVIFFVTNSNFGNVWAGGVTSTDGKSVRVNFFHLSPRRKIPISWRGIAGVSAGWLENEFRNALLIQSGHGDLAR